MSKLSNLLTKIEESSGAFSIQVLARELDLTPERVESMLEYWVRKGRLLAVSSTPDCAGCASGSSCSFLIDFPITYQVTPEETLQKVEIKPPCQ